MTGVTRPVVLPRLNILRRDADGNDMAVAASLLFVVTVWLVRLGHRALADIEALESGPEF